MAALPPELGRRIIKTIMKTPKSDDKELRKKAEEIENNLTEAEKKND